MTFRKNLILTLALAALTIAATGCGKQCKQAKEEVLLPTQNVLVYLQSNPNGETLKATGCSSILEQLKNIPAGSETIRNMAHSYYASTYNTCREFRTEYRQFCRWYGYGHNRYWSCHVEPWTYCVWWDTQTVTKEPQFTTTMNYAHDLDLMLNMANNVCSLAAGGDTASAETESKFLLKFMQNNVSTQGQKIYQDTCGN